MILLTLACETAIPTLLIGQEEPTPTWDAPAQALVFQYDGSLDGDARPWTAGDLDGDGREELVGVDDDHRIVVWNPDIEVIPADLETALQGEDPWIQQLEVVGGRIVAGVTAREGERYERHVVSITPGGAVTILAKASAFNAVADVDGDGFSELLFYSDNRSWMELSDGGEIRLPDDLNWTWNPTAVTLDFGNIVILNDGGYGIHQAFVVNPRVGSVRELEPLYASHVATDGSPGRRATQLVLSAWDTRLRFIDGDFQPFHFGDFATVLAGNLDGHGGADLLGWTDEPVGLVADGRDLNDVSVHGLDQDLWSAVPADLDGDGLDDVVAPVWNDDGSSHLAVYMNLTRQ